MAWAVQFCLSSCGRLSSKLRLRHGLGHQLATRHAALPMLVMPARLTPEMLSPRNHRGTTRGSRDILGAVPTQSGGEGNADLQRDTPLDRHRWRRRSGGICTATSRSSWWATTT